jgi:hypothetical protein
MDIATADCLAIDSEVLPLAGDWLLDVVELSTFIGRPEASVDRGLEELVEEGAVYLQGIPRLVHRSQVL